MAAAEQLEVPGTGRNYPPGVKKALKKCQASRGVLIDARVEAKKDEQKLIDEMISTDTQVVVDDTADPPWVLKLTDKKSIKRSRLKPKASEKEE